jgi:hypothetical protein
MVAFAFTRNPIAQREIRYHLRTGVQKIGRIRRAIRWLIYGTALLTAVFFFWMQFAASILRRDTSFIFESNEIVVLMIYLVIFTISQAIIVALRTISTGANSIAREKQSGTWEMLLLTGIDARRIVLGKWWGAIRGVQRDVLMLLPLRVGVTMLAAYLTSRPYYASYYYGYSNYYSYTINPPHPLGILLMIPLISLFTFAAVGLTAAIGVLASAALRRPQFALAAGVVTYLTVSIGSIIGVAWIGTHLWNDYYNYGNYDFYLVATNTLTFAAATLAENGTLMTSMLGYYQVIYGATATPTEWRYTAGYLLGGGSALLLILWGTGVFLVLAQRFAVRSGALRPPKKKRI